MFCLFWASPNNWTILNFFHFQVANCLLHCVNVCAHNSHLLIALGKRKRKTTTTTMMMMMMMINDNDKLLPAALLSEAACWLWWPAAARCQSWNCFLDAASLADAASACLAFCDWSKFSSCFTSCNSNWPVSDSVLSCLCCLSPWAMRRVESHRAALVLVHAAVILRQGR